MDRWGPQQHGLTLAMTHNQWINNLGWMWRCVATAEAEVCAWGTGVVVVLMRGKQRHDIKISWSTEECAGSSEARRERTRRPEQPRYDFSTVQRKALDLGQNYMLRKTAERPVHEHGISLASPITRQQNQQ